MEMLLRGCETIFLLIALILSTAPTDIQGQRKRTVTQGQIEGVLKRFKTSGLGLSYEAKLKQILDCLNLPIPNPECFKESLKTLVINEILLRGQMREMGEECTSDGKYRTAFDIANVRESEDSHRILQDVLLNTGLTFCNPFKYLYCSPQKKCECRPGTVLKPDMSRDVCTLTVGGYCLSKHTIFDPFNSARIDSFTEIPALECLEGEERECSVLSYYHYGVCANDVILKLDKKLVEHFRDMPRLSYDDPCNFKQHNELLKPPEAEWSDYTIRVKKLEEIVASKTQFCDLERLLVCGNSGKCECISPAFYDENKKNCTYTHSHVFCTQRNSIAVFGASAGLTRIPGIHVRAGFKNAESRECKGGCIDLGGRPSRGLCKICRDPAKTGRNCDKTLTLFLNGRPQIALPRDEPDWEKQIDLLTELSNKGLELEKILRLDKGDLCYMEAELEGVRAVRRIKNLEVDGTVATKEYYREIIRFTDEVIRNYSTKGLCKYPERTALRRQDESGALSIVNSKFRPDLVCGPSNATNPTCYELKDDDEYLEILKKRLVPFETIPDGQPCPLGLDQLLRRSKGVLIRGSNDYLIGRLETYFVNKTQFCNTKSGLKCKENSKSMTDIGKCGFSKEMNSGDLRTNAINSIRVLFFVSLLMFYCTLA